MENIIKIIRHRLFLGQKVEDFAGELTQRFNISSDELRLYIVAAQMLNEDAHTDTHDYVTVDKGRGRIYPSKKTNV